MTQSVHKKGFILGFTDLLTTINLCTGAFLLYARSDGLFFYFLSFLISDQVLKRFPGLPI